MNRDPETGLDLAQEAVRKDAHTREKNRAINQTLKILRKREGTFLTINKAGQYVEFDHGDLWDELTGGADRALLSVFAQANIAAIIGMATSPAIQRQAFDTLLELIDGFAETHAKRAAEKAVEVYMVELGETA